MSDKIEVQKLDETWFKIDGPDHFCQALSDHFSFEVENLHHMRRKNPKLKYWDGRVRLYKKKQRLLPHGLIHEAWDWMAANSQLEINVTLPPAEIQSKSFLFNEKLFAQLVKQAQEDNPKFVFAEDQYLAVKHCLLERRALLVSPTSSGKSFIIFAVQQHIKKKTLIIVPTVQLTGQMEKDFMRYGFDGNVHKLYYGQDRSFEVQDGDVVIGTWHTLSKMPEEFFLQFNLLIGDEVHEYEANTVSSVIESCKRAYYKIGTTGSLKNSKMHKLTLQGLFGPIFQAITTKELMDEGRVSPLKINVVVLKYSEADRKAFWKGPHTYNDELQFLFNHENRTRTITKLALSLSKNTLIMFRRNAYGLDLYTKLGLDSNHNKKLFYVDGTIDLSERQDLVKYFEENNDGIGVVSFGTFQRGISIHNLHHLIYAVPNKSETTTVQSIGRLLRLHDEKDRATLWDFVDDLALNGQTNASLDHFYARMQEYAAAGFVVTFSEISI